MKKLALLVVLILLVTPAWANCPSSASCPDHGISGYPTGAHKWNGSVQYAQFEHPRSGNTPGHKWWERCD